TFTYTLNADGNRTQTVDLGGTTTYTYDAGQRLTNVKYPGQAFGDQYSYDADGNRTTKFPDSGTAVNYIYDAADELTGTQTGAGTYNDIASDSFASCNFSGGTGWQSSSWTTSGNATAVSTGTPHTTPCHLREDTTGTASRTVNLAGYSQPHLKFWAK